MDKKRVAVTGLGIVSPVGNQVDEAWANIVNGISGIDTISKFDASNLSSRIAGEVRSFPLDTYLSVKEARHMDTFIHYGIAASVQAIEDAGLVYDAAYDAEQIGVIIGSGIGGLALIESTHSELMNRGPRRVSPFFIPGAITNMVSGHVSIRYGFLGPNLAISTACSTSAHSIALAYDMIQRGQADAMVAGGSEAAITELGVAGFAAARALSCRNDDPSVASRPWDKQRDGFVLGEGAGILVLEDFDRAKRRGAKIYCELAGHAMNADAFHITAPSDDGRGAYACIQRALHCAQLNSSEVQYINAHGTSTPLGDIAETRAVKRVFADQANHLVMSSTKSMTGHSLGAAGGMEAVFSVLSVKHQVAPPTINLSEPDEGCDLDYCAHTARDWVINHALSNSFGFGGTNACLVFSKI